MPYRLCVFTERVPHRADVSYDSTAGYVKGPNVLHVCKQQALPFPTPSEISPAARKTHDKEGLLLDWTDLKRASAVLTRGQLV